METVDQTQCSTDTARVGLATVDRIQSIRCSVDQLARGHARSNIDVAHRARTLAIDCARPAAMTRIVAYGCLRRALRIVLACNAGPAGPTVGSRRRGRAVLIGVARTDACRVHAERCRLAAIRGGVALNARVVGIADLIVAARAQSAHAQHRALGVGDTTEPRRRLRASR